MAGLQAAQELPGFLLHEELVFGAPTGHRLPGTGHLRGGERVSSVQTLEVLTRTPPLSMDAGSSLHFLGGSRGVRPHLLL